MPWLFQTGNKSSFLREGSWIVWPEFTSDTSIRRRRLVGESSDLWANKNVIWTFVFVCICIRIVMAKIQGIMLCILLIAVPCLQMEMCVFRWVVGWILHVIKDAPVRSQNPRLFQHRQGAVGWSSNTLAEGTVSMETNDPLQSGQHRWEPCWCLYERVLTFIFDYRNFYSLYCPFIYGFTYFTKKKRQLSTP